MKPELRFLEFEENWSYKKLKDLLKVHSGRDYKHLEPGEIPVYGTGGYMLSVSDYLSNDDAIGIGRKGTINKPYLLKAPFWTVDTLFYCTPWEEVDLYFLLSLFKKINWEKYDESTSVPSLSKVNIEKLKVYSCELEEQRKIGDFFSKLDRQIELEEQKLAKLEEQKKGYMQKLFSQELRFKTKDNVYYSEWQLHKLGEIFKYSQGKQISVDKQFSVKSNEMKRFIRIVDITENPEPRFVLYESDTGLVNKEDLFMIRYGRPGIVSIGFEGIIANNLFKLIPKIKISTVYFYYLLSYNYYRINLLTNQSTMPALNFKSLDSLKFKIPSYKEQNKIGNFFTKFDELIEKQNKKIDGLKERKKGLLQKMFV
ncbi:restriction endonuclease subunit S [Staphylococcus aureus]|uniref:restriction endonuclease subunit S n=1 Tax=Staphylococcus aureus TaxID=1280 RepID=UPI000B958762|nr:restriction endonuclease subunit S [Staphylococcus aureus]